MKICARLLLLSVLCQTAACSYLFGDNSYFRDRGGDYRKAPIEAPLEVPEGLDGSTLQNIYVIPPIADDVRPTGEFVVPRPAPLVAGAVDQMVRIQKLGDERWILVAEAPGQLWPQVRSYINSKRFKVVRVDARAGLMETDWSQPEGAPMAERYQFRIDQGVQRNTTELHVVQMVQAGDVDSWPAQSSNREREHALLQDIAQYIANSSDQAPVSMVAQQAISATGKVSLREDDSGATYIRLELPFYRAWAAVGRALPESGFVENDRDRSRGIFFTQFKPATEEKDAGWFNWMFGDDEHEHSHLMGIHYLVRVVESGSEQVTITIEAEDAATALSEAESQRLLAVIKGNIH